MAAFEWLGLAQIWRERGFYIKGLALSREIRHLSFTSSFDLLAKSKKKREKGYIYGDIGIFCWQHNLNWLFQFCFVLWNNESSIIPMIKVKKIMYMKFAMSMLNGYFATVVNFPIDSNPQGQHPVPSV